MWHDLNNSAVALMQHSVIKDPTTDASPALPDYGFASIQATVLRLAPWTEEGQAKC